MPQRDGPQRDGPQRDGPPRDRVRRDRPARLGRGLAALFSEMPERDDDATRTLPLDDLEPGPFQPRKSFDPDAMEEFAASIKARGVLQPILVRTHPDNPARFQIIAGERRWQAAGLAGLDAIPVLVRDFSDADAMAAGLVENLQRADLDAMEEANGMRRLLDEFGLTQDQLGQAISKSRSHVANSLRLLALPPSVQAHVSAGRLSAGHARAALAHADPESAAEQMIKRQLSVRDAERLAVAAPARARRRTPPDVDTAHLAARLSERLGLLVSIHHAGAGGRVSIHYKTLDQLDSLLKRLA